MANITKNMPFLTYYYQPSAISYNSTISRIILIILHPITDYQKK